MILNEICQYISIDEIVAESSENFVHFLTHVDKIFSVPSNWKSVIYTSSHIMKPLGFKKHSISKKYFRILQKDEEVTINLHDNINVKVTMFELSEITRNTAYHFEAENIKVLYIGPFTVCREILLNDCFRERVRNDVDILYLDNTRANCTIDTSEFDVGKQLEYILCKHPEHQILLNLPPYGCEELIFALLEQFTFKICVGKVILEIFKNIKLSRSFETNIKKANVIIGEESVTEEKIKQRFEQQKRITVRIIGGNSNYKNSFMESIGLYQINWSRHPSVFELEKIISFVAPRHLKEIHRDMPKFPKFLQDNCFIKITRKQKNSINKQEYVNDNDQTIRNENQNFINVSQHNKDDNSQKLKPNSTSIKNCKRKRNDVISISSDEQETNYQHNRIKLPRRKRRGKKKRKRIDGTVAPNNIKNINKTITFVNDDNIKEERFNKQKSNAFKENRKYSHLIDVYTIPSSDSSSNKEDPPSRRRTEAKENFNPQKDNVKLNQQNVVTIHEKIKVQFFCNFNGVVYT